MRYYTVKISIATDGTETRDVRGFDTMAEALIKYHSDLSTNISKVTQITELLIMIGTEFTLKKHEIWVASDTTTEE